MTPSIRQATRPVRQRSKTQHIVDPEPLPARVNFEKDVVAIGGFDHINGSKRQAGQLHDTEEPTLYLIGKGHCMMRQLGFAVRRQSTAAAGSDCESIAAANTCRPTTVMRKSCFLGTSSW